MGIGGGGGVCGKRVGGGIGSVCGDSVDGACGKSVGGRGGAGAMCGNYFSGAVGGVGVLLGGHHDIVLCVRGEGVGGE